MSLRLVSSHNKVRFKVNAKIRNRTTPRFSEVSILFGCIRVPFTQLGEAFQLKLPSSW